MACVENIPPANADSEMEEGEIVDDLSDISSEEEFLLRQRLHVLEKYNNVLERKKAKQSFTGSDKLRDDFHLNDLSEISEPDDSFQKNSIVVLRPEVINKHVKSHHKHRRREDVKFHTLNKNKECKKKANRKKKIEVKVISESSEESEDDYRNKRRRLADAVSVKRQANHDPSSLQARLQNMLYGTKPQQSIKQSLKVDKGTEIDMLPRVEDVSCSPISTPSNNISTQVPKETQDKELQTVVQTTEAITECIVLSTDEEVTVVKSDQCDAVTSTDTKEIYNEQKKEENKDSDEDLELLRQHALKTKASKPKGIKSNPPAESEKPVPLSDEEDSDTAELRLICLKSALLKKAIEMKRKQKLKKRLSQSSNLQDESLKEQEEFMAKIESDNNTDIESVDMDIGSDADEKTKDVPTENVKSNQKEQDITQNKTNNKVIPSNRPKEDEIEEDEDLLRAQLLISLSKNLPNLVDPKVINSIEDDRKVEKSVPVTKTQVKVPENRIVINLGESDSEGEHEATKNLTKMHIKLSEQIDFQEKLDLFLKSTRMEVEKSKVPDVAQNPVLPKTPQKFVAKAVNHLPKSEQIEYKNLVKRMAELEKIKEARQSSMNLPNKVQVKETLKPRNVTVDPAKLSTVNNNLEEQIAMSRKTIAEESAKMLKLKEEATKLSQKYKIVATELKNISTAITLNKKEQRTVQNKLSRIRIQHQRLLNSSSSKHSKTNGQMHPITRPINKIAPIAKLQKENDPSKEELKASKIISVKMNICSDLKEETNLLHSRLSQLDVGNRKTMKVKDSSQHSEDVRKVQREKENANNCTEISKESNFNSVAEKDEGVRRSSEENTGNQKEKKQEFDDYESPLQALGNASWEADPNAILCPFEVGGNCKDPDCKYLHPKAPS